MQRPWNLPSLPVYSLATYAAGKVNMNICTYVTAVSLKPKWMAVAVYEGTKTLQNLEQNQRAVLQLLGANQYPLVNHLGKKSGKKVDKDSWLYKKQMTMNWKGHTVLKGCAACMELSYKTHLTTRDHKLYLFEVTKASSFHSELLTTQILSLHKIIRI